MKRASSFHFGTIRQFSIRSLSCASWTSFTYDTLPPRRGRVGEGVIGVTSKKHPHLVFPHSKLCRIVILRRSRRISSSQVTENARCFAEFILSSIEGLSMTSMRFFSLRPSLSREKVDDGGRKLPRIFLFITKLLQCGALLPCAASSNASPSMTPVMYSL